MAELLTLARPYARAIFACALADGLDVWSQQLAMIVAVVQQPSFQPVLTSPSLTHQQRADYLIEVCGDVLTEHGKNFIKVLAENHRLSLLPEMTQLFERYKAEREQRVEVEVATAFALDTKVEQKLAAALRGKLERDVDLHTHVDDSLLGGVSIRVGGLVIDGSVRGRLQKLAATLQQ